MSSACESVSLPRNKIDMIHIIWSSIMYPSKVLTNYFTDDSNRIQHARTNASGIWFGTWLLEPISWPYCMTTIIAISTMIYYLLKGDSTYANTNQPNWWLKWDSTDSYLKMHQYGIKSEISLKMCFNVQKTLIQIIRWPKWDSTYSHNAEL